MLGPIFNLIGNLFGEDKSRDENGIEQYLEDPEDFCPGFLFDVSASWILFVRQLLVPDFVRNIKQGCPVYCICKCYKECADHSKCK